METFRRARALVLEDDPRVARLLTRILEGEGIEVDTVYGGEEALGRLAVDHYCPYDLVVLDLLMPGVNGLQVVKYIINHRRDLLDRLLITSSATERDHPEMVGSAAIRIPWILKPYHPPDIAAKVREILEAAEPRSPLQRSFR